MKQLQLYEHHFIEILVALLAMVAILFLSFSTSSMEEICDNALDDDRDGLIDINDPDCVCEVLEPISLIPNPSFEDLNCCPSGRSQLNCAEVWIQASEPTTDLIHSCNWLGWENLPPPMPFPDGEGIMGFRDGRVRGNNAPERNWKEYAGACLISPLEIGNAYRFEFDVGFINATNSPPINITFFGTSDCDNLPFGNGDAAFGCPTNGPNWVNLGSTLLSGGSGNQWVKGVIEVVPNETIRAIAIGPECLGTRANVNTYYFFDNLLLSDFESFELKVAATAHPCNDDFTLQIADIDNYVYQWYKDGIALIGETSAELTKIYGEGNYQVRLDDGLDCRVSANFTYTVPVFSESINRTICKESTFQFGDLELDKTGIYVDTFRTEEGCKNIVNLDLKVLGTLADTVQAKIFEGEQHIIGNQAFRIEGDYLVNLTSDLGCDSLVLLQLDYYKVYLPNAFSPNFDNTNDVFTISSENELIENIALSIFDRWGNLLFKGMEWDGQYKGKVVNPGVFFYVADITMNDGITRQFSGDITVLK